MGCALQAQHPAGCKKAINCAFHRENRTEIGGGVDQQKSGQSTHKSRPEWHVLCAYYAYVTQNPTPDCFCPENSRQRNKTIIPIRWEQVRNGPFIGKVFLRLSVSPKHQGRSTSGSARRAAPARSSRRYKPAGYLSSLSCSCQERLVLRQFQRSSRRPLTSMSVAESSPR